MIPARILTKFCLPALLMLLACTAALRAADNAPVTDIPPAPTGSIWSVQTDSARNPAGAAQAVLRMRSSVAPEARLLLLYGSDNSLWYVVELTASPDREAARQAAEAYLRTSGRKALVRQMDAALHEARTVPDALLHEPQNIASHAVGNTAAAPGPQTAPVSPAKPAPVMADNEQPAPVQADDEQSTPVLADNEQSATVLADNEQSATVLAEGEQPAPENAEAANAEAAVAPEQNTPYTPFNADGRQAELIIARSTFMQGDHENARAMYRVLLAKYGPDEEITSGYVETLLEGKRWAEAEAELAAWR
ncbi:MAG: tetratricopeptide repeat protein, partial [Halodesulfovibrio sp.]